MNQKTRRVFLQTSGFASVFGVTGCLRLDSAESASTSEEAVDGADSTSTSEETADGADSTTTSEEAADGADSTSTSEEAADSEESTSTPEEASNQYTIVQGSVSSEAGVSLERHNVEIYNVNTREFYNLSIDDGSFVQTVEPDSSINITFYYEREGRATDVDNVPLLYSLADELYVSGEKQTLGQLTLPQAYRTEIRIVDPDGNPVENFPIRFRCPNGSGTGVREFTTNADGYAKFVDAPQTGFYFAGTVTVEGGENNGGTRLREINVTEQNEYTIEVFPDRYNL